MEEKVNVVSIKTDFIKLDSFLKFSQLVDSGGLAKIMIQEGLVKVNDEVATQRGKKLRDGDLVEVKVKDELNGVYKIYKLKVVSEV